MPVHKFLLALLLGVLPILSHADLSATNGKDTVVLHTAACTLPKVLAQIPPPKHPEFFLGTATVGKDTFMMCWTPMGRAVGLIYEDGDRGIIPAEDFKERGV